MRTSVNLRMIDIPRLEKASEKCALKKSVIISRCLRRLFSSQNKRLQVSRLYRLVEYQPRGAGYRIVNVSFEVDGYNLNVNFRLFCRFSVSLLVTIALALFLEEVVGEVMGGRRSPINYAETIHERRHNSKNSITDWKIVWKIETKSPT